METTEKKKYGDYVKAVTPTRNIWLQMLKAFLIGGAICVLGQGIQDLFMTLVSDKEKAGMWCSIILILLSALTTGFGWYAILAKWAGAGALVPITGFANSVAASAIEYKKEGQVFGVGSKIFIIAGPVILYGIFSSWVLGLFYWLGTVFGWW